MANNDVITLTGVVIDRLPGAKFKIKLENDQVVTGHLSGKMRTNFIKIIEDGMEKSKTCNVSTSDSVMSVKTKKLAPRPTEDRPRIYRLVGRKRCAFLYHLYQSRQGEHA